MEGEDSLVIEPSRGGGPSNRQETVDEPGGTFPGLAEGAEGTGGL